MSTRTTLYEEKYYRVELCLDEEVYWHEPTGTWLNYIVVNSTNDRIEEFFADFRDAVRCCATLSMFSEAIFQKQTAEDSGIVMPSDVDLAKFVKQ